MNLKKALRKIILIKDAYNSFMTILLRNSKEKVELCIDNALENVYNFDFLDYL